MSPRVASSPAYAIGVPALRERVALAGSPAPAVGFAVAEVSLRDAVPALKVRYGPEEDGDEVTLLAHRGRLFAPWDGTDHWQHGPRAGERGASPERLSELLAAGLHGALRNLLAPEKSQFRLRSGPIPLSDPEAEVAARATALLFVDGRLHRRAAEPTWRIVRNAEAGIVRPRIEVLADGPKYSLLHVRFDRTETAERLAALKAGRHRGCRAVAPVGAVEVLDPAYEPSFDVETEIATTYGDKTLRQIEPALLELRRPCVEAFAEMRQALGELGSDPAAGSRFCDGLAAFCDRLGAERAAIPHDLKNWYREWAPGFAERLAFAREAEREGPAPAP